MKVRPLPLALLAGCASLSGCVAVIAPIAATGAIGSKSVLRHKGSAVDPAPTPQVASEALPVGPAAIAPPGARPPASPPAMAPAPSAPVAAALPKQGWRAMVTYVADLVQAKARPVNGAVLAPGATRTFLPCEAKPFAVVVDADGTVLPPPGAALVAGGATAEAAQAFDDLRFGHVAVIFTSVRPPSEAAAVADALQKAKLGPAKPGSDLLLGAVDKDAQRLALADQYCVLALVGNDLADFTSRAAAGSTAPWGAGWFRVPATGATR